MSKEEKKVTSGIIQEEPRTAPIRGPLGGFQSKDAMEAAAPVEDDEDDDDESREIPLAEVRVSAQADKKAVRVEDPQRLVRVRSREYIAPFFYGPKQYSLPANKVVMIPLCVKRHLEEKMLL